MNIVKRQIAYNRSQRTKPPIYIVIHDTGNRGKGANAESHYDYFNGGDRDSSADFFVDDKQILQVNDYHTFYTWHCGDGGGKYGITNANSIGIEICVNSDGNYNIAFANAVELTKQLMAELGIDAAHVVRHYDASRKNCPASMSANDWAYWQDFKNRIENEEEDLNMSQYDELLEKIEAQEERIKKLTPKVYNYVDDFMPAWARPYVIKAKEKGLIKGDEKGNLNLTDEKIFTLALILRAHGIMK